jgi:hypothetical protein
MKLKIFRLFALMANSERPSVSRVIQKYSLLNCCAFLNNLQLLYIWE